MESLKPVTTKTRQSNSAQVCASEKSTPHGDSCLEVTWSSYQDTSDDRIPGPATEGHTLTALHGGKTLLKFGGRGKSGKTNAVFEYDTSSNKWTEAYSTGNFPAPRFGHGAASIGSQQDRLLIFGGSSNNGRLNDLAIFRSDTSTWSMLKASGSAPKARLRCDMASLSDVAYIFGGRTTYRYIGGQYFDDVFAFNAERAQWVQIQAKGKGPAARSGCVVEVINDRQLFVHGGYDDGAAYYGDIFIFDLASSTWNQTPYPGEPTAPKPREGHSSAVMNGNVLVHGGELEVGCVSSKLCVFDTSRMRWIDGPTLDRSLPALRGGAMAATDRSSIVLAGGDRGHCLSGDSYLLEVASYPKDSVETLCRKAVERGVRGTMCVVCMDEEVSAMFLWCGHVVCCEKCSVKVSACPICRRAVSSIHHGAFS